MADNVPVTPGSGKDIRTRENGDIHRQVVAEEQLTFASSNGSPINTATDTDAVAAPAASNHLQIWRLHASNKGSNPVTVSWRDGAAGAKLFETYLPQNGILSIKLNGDWDLTSATKLVINTDAAGSVYWTVGYVTLPD